MCSTVLCKYGCSDSGCCAVCSCLSVGLCLGYGGVSRVIVVCRVHGFVLWRRSCGNDRVC